MNPYQVIAQLAPKAKDANHLAELAAQFAGPVAQATPAPMPMVQPAQPLAMPTSPLVTQRPIFAKPPMTQGEARTAPNIGATLLGV